MVTENTVPKEPKNFTDLALQVCEARSLTGKAKVKKLGQGATCDFLAKAGEFVGDGPAWLAALTAASMPTPEAATIALGTFAVMKAATIESPQHPTLNTVLDSVRWAGVTGSSTILLTRTGIDTGSAIAASSIISTARTLAETAPQNEATFPGRLGLAAEKVTDPFGTLIQAGFDRWAIKLAQNILKK